VQKKMGSGLGSGGSVVKVNEASRRRESSGGLGLVAIKGKTLGAYGKKRYDEKGSQREGGKAAVKAGSREMGEGT